MAPGLGLEPRQEDPESPVLPLHHPGRNSHYYSKDKIKCNPFFEIFFTKKRASPLPSFGKSKKGGTPLRSAFLLLEFPVNSSTDIVGPAKVVAHIPFGIDIEGLVLSNDRAVTKTDDPPVPRRLPAVR